MVFPPSKPADRYNMEVAALIKFRGLQGVSYDLKAASVSMYPAPISAEMSLVGARLSFDIIASTAHWEVLIECKFFEEPRPITPKSLLFTQSLAECICAEPLRKAGNKEYKFIFISNGDTSSLVHEIGELRLLDGRDFDDYLEKIKAAAAKKWPGSNPKVENITPKLLRKYLIELRVFTIDNGTLESLRTNPDYMQLCHEIYAERPYLAQIEDNTTSPTAIILKYLGDEYLPARWKGNRVHISEEFLRWISGMTISSSELVKEVAFESIPSAEDMKFLYPSDILPESADESITACVNDELVERASTHMVILNMSKRRLYLVNHEELFRRSSALSESNYKIALDRVKEQYKLPIGGSFLKLAIQESYRAKGIILSDEYLID